MVKLHDRSANRQAQTSAANAMSISSKEFFKNTIFIARHKAGPDIAKRDDDSLAVLEGRDFYRCSRGRVLSRILQNVREYLFHQHRVYPDERKIGRNGGRNRSSAQQLVDAIQRRANDL